MFSMRMTRVNILTIFAWFLLIAPSNSKEKVLPIVLTESTWSEMTTGEWMVEFYAPWCPACRQLTEVWEQFSSWSKDLDIKVAKVDVTENPGLSGRFLIFALPTIYHVKDGVFRQYAGSREENEFISFVDDKKWQSVEPVPWWKNPSYPHMAVVSWFFKSAMVVRSTFNLITEDYGYPAWVAYVVFALSTVVAGLLLGLCFVCCCDFLCPPRYREQPLPEKETLSKEKDSDEEEEGEQLEDHPVTEAGNGDGDASASARRRKIRKD